MRGWTAIRWRSPRLRSRVLVLGRALGVRRRVDVAVLLVGRADQFLENEIDAQAI